MLILEGDDETQFEWSKISFEEVCVCEAKKAQAIRPKSREGSPGERMLKRHEHG